ncbi:MAG: tellurite resistance TerB family protein [Rhizobiaceae bacterium]
MLDPKKLLDELLGSKVPGTEGTVRDKAGQAVDMAKKNPLAAGAIVAVLLGTRAGRNLTGSAVQLGGLAAIAGLGYKAWQNYKSGGKPVETAQTGEPVLIEAPSGSGFDATAATAESKEFALVLVRAMIAAARADGHIDDAERGRIGDKLALAGLDREAQEFLTRELEAPVDLDAIIAAAQSEAQKVELYTASRLAIEPQTRAERGYLDLLAGRLQLPDALIDHIEATVSQAKAAV